ncbi:MAG: hypothetical protein JXJ04_05300 [Spirochaetales bacterium]|nr:hypothetical protein [Spirochaetales bacterium]
MRGYIALIRNSLISYFFFRAEFFFRLLGNFLEIFIVFYLWRAIYTNSTGELNGLTFLQTFAYLSVSGTIFTMVSTMVDWEMSLGIIHGEIIMDLYLPMDLHVQTIVRAFGVFLYRVIFAGLPGILFIILAFHVPIVIGVNILFFMISIFFSFLISVNIDFAIGVSAFSFESALGLKIVKDTVILFLSGAVIPIPFFPKAIQPVIMVLPFQSMFYTPVKLLLTRQSIPEALLLLCIQAGWFLLFIILGRLFYRKVLVKLTVSGG